MASAPNWPIEASSLGAATCGTVAFKTAGRVHVAIVVKATFAFVRDRPMVPVDPEPIAVTDQHLEQNPARSLIVAGDLAPYRPAADVTLHGHAVAFQGRPARSFQVRMMVAREGRTILDKPLFVRGSRDRSSASPEPVPFLKMPLVYELAARGIDPGDNPSGIPERPGSTANILDPRRPGLPAGFGPIPEHWTARRATLGAMVDPRILRTSLPSFPEGFPWAFFHAAPEDQRIPFLQGDEWIALEGMHADTTRVTSALPGVRAVARVYGNKDDPPGGRPVQLAADTLSIDADRERCSVVWRGSFPIAGAADLGRLRVLGAVEIGGRGSAFPASLASPDARPSKPAAPAIPAPAMPFVAPPAGGSSVSPTGAPKSIRSHVDSGTKALTAITEEQAHSARSMPFVPIGTDSGTAPAEPSPISRPATPFVPAAPVSSDGARRVIALDRTITPDAAPPAPATPFERIARPAPKIDDPLARTIAPEGRARVPRRTMPFKAITVRGAASSGGSGVAATPSRPMAATPFARVAAPNPRIALDQTISPEASVIPRAVVPFQSPVAPPPTSVEIIARPSLTTPPERIALVNEGDAPATLGAHFLAAMRRAGISAAPA
jgi:hypothetical protein